MSSIIQTLNDYHKTGDGKYANLPLKTSYKRPLTQKSGTMKTLFMPVKQKKGVLLIRLALSFILLNISALVIAQQQPNCTCASCGYACGSGHASTCKYNNSSTSNNGSSTNSGTSFSANLKAYKENRQAQKLANALEFNQKGIEEYKRENWETAVKYFKKALKNSPHDAVIKNNLKNAEDAYSFDKRLKDAEETTRKDKENQRKWEQEQRKKETEQQQALQKATKEAMDKNLKDAQLKIYSLQKDIIRIQQSLKVYSKSLQNNSSEFEKWGATVDEAYNNVIDNSKDYLANMFLKYNLMGGLKREEQKIIFNKLRDILGSSNPALQEWLIKIGKSKVVDLDEVEDIIDRVNATGDLAVLLTGDKSTVKHNLDALLLVNSLVETFNLAGYKDYIKNISKPFGFDNMPGDYYEQAKMIGETYADLTAICWSWFQINRLTTGTNEMAIEIDHLSANMQHQMNEIDCLKKCMKDYTPGCVQRCTGVTRLSTPPPLLR